MSEVHAKLYFYNYKGVVKEIRRIGLHLLADHSNWPVVHSTIQELFAVDDAAFTYEDPEKDRVAVGSQAEWTECLRLALYSLQSPLRLHVTKKRGSRDTRSKPRDDVTLVPVDAYTTNGLAIPQDIERIKVVVPEVVRCFMHADGTLPGWLQGAMQQVSHPSGEIDFHVDVDRLALLLSERALRLMSAAEPNLPAALALFQAARTIKPASEKLVYNIACCHALLGAAEEALAALEAAMAMGFNDYTHLMQDEDLSSLRADARFCSLASRIAPPAEEDAVAEMQPEPMPDAAEDAPMDALSDREAGSVASLPESAAESEASLRDEYETINEPNMPYAEQLDRMRTMGFLNDEASMQALVEAQGCIPVAIDRLLA